MDVCSVCTLVETKTSTRVCTTCGKETFYLPNCSHQNCGFAMRHSPFLSGYSRTKRFKGMVESLFWPTPSNPDTPMLTYFTGKKINSLEDVIHTITTAPLKDKRFVSIHLFARIFDPQYTEPTHGDLHQMLKRMVFQFQRIESCFERIFINEPFINYTFLIKHLLTKLGFTSYLPFVKKLKCPKRKKRYIEMLNILTCGD